MNLELVYAVVLALGAAFIGGLVGGFALMRRMSLAGDAVSHIALPGLGMALLENVMPKGRRSPLFQQHMHDARPKEKGLLTRIHSIP